jgi:hypothetical protein
LRDALEIEPAGAVGVVRFQTLPELGLGAIPVARPIAGETPPEGLDPVEASRPA